MESVVLTHLTIPEVKQLFRQELRDFFKEFNPAQPSTVQDEWMSLKHLCEYLPDKPAEQTVYGWVSAGIIPVHKGSKKLRFLKAEIDNWLKAGRKLATTDAAAAADHFLKGKRKGVAA